SAKLGFQTVYSPSVGAWYRLDASTKRWVRVTGADLKVCQDELANVQVSEEQKSRGSSFGKFLDTPVGGAVQALTPPALKYMLTAEAATAAGGAAAIRSSFLNARAMRDEGALAVDQLVSGLRS